LRLPGIIIDPDVVTVVEQAERFVDVAGAEHRISVFFKCPGNIEKNPYLVLNHQDRRLPIFARSTHIGEMTETELSSDKSSAAGNHDKFLVNSELPTDRRG